MIGAFLGIMIGGVAWFVVRYLFTGFYTVEQNERAVKTCFGRAERIEGRTTLDDIALTAGLRDTERDRYCYPMVRVIPPGGPYFKFPWEKIYKVSIAIETVSIGFDPETPSANRNGQSLESVTKDQLNTGLSGQIRYMVSDRNLYAYLFGVKNPEAHIMGFLISVLRNRIANFEAKVKPVEEGAALKDMDISQITGISINDLRKNLRDINSHMVDECLTSSARYGIKLEAALITGIDPPPEVDAALAAINTAHNEVSSEISVAQANADQRIVESKRAVEIQTLNAQAEVEPLNWLASQLRELKNSGPDALSSYLRNIRLDLYKKANHIILEMKK